MVSTQENIFDAVKKAGTRSIYDFVNIYKDFILDLNMYSSQFRDGFNFNQFSSFKDSFEFIEEIRKNHLSLQFLSLCFTLLIYLLGTMVIFSFISYEN